MKNKKLFYITAIATTILFSLVLITSCSKERSCYSQSLYKKSKDSACPTDCPGVQGCDGKTYCNGCEAARHGITVVQ